MARKPAYSGFREMSFEMGVHMGPYKPGLCRLHTNHSKNVRMDPNLEPDQSTM